MYSLSADMQPGAAKQHPQGTRLALAIMYDVNYITHYLIMYYITYRKLLNIEQFMIKVAEMFMKL